MAKIGDRVGAISHADNGIVYFFGYGTYEGNTIPPNNVGGFNFGVPNPTIKLDNGKTVYGCECWWGDEEEVKKRLEAYKKIVNVDPVRNDN